MRATEYTYGLLYAAQPLAGWAPGSRPPYAIESAEAEALLQTLRAEDAVGAASKAHARGMVAAAAARTGRVGIDIEYRAPGRRILEIAHWLMDAPAPDEDSAYRVFTFREAWFKAMGDAPECALMQRIAAGEAVDGVLFETPAPYFMLALVWTP